MAHEIFLKNALEVIENDETIIGLTIGGSWLANEIDEYSDLDLILVTREKAAGDRGKMLAYAASIGHLLSGFTGEHVGEPRLLICLYENPLLHVDIKFLTPAEFAARVENPVILHDTAGQLEKILEETEASYPFPDYQWIEDRFWIWIHYATLKLGRGELMEAFDFSGFLRMVVFGPLLLIKNGHPPRGVRKVEMKLIKEDLEQLQLTIPAYNAASIAAALQHSITLYRELRILLYSGEVTLQTATENCAVDYFHKVRTEVLNPVKSARL